MKIPAGFADFFLFALASLTGAAYIAYASAASAQPDGDPSPIYGVKVPAGYRDWQLIAVNQLLFPGKGEQLRAQFGNDIAIRTFKEKTLRSRTVPSLPRFIGLAPRRKILGWLL